MRVFKTLFEKTKIIEEVKRVGHEMREKAKVPIERDISPTTMASRPIKWAEMINLSRTLW